MKNGQPAGLKLYGGAYAEKVHGQSHFIRKFR